MLAALTYSSGGYRLTIGNLKNVGHQVITLNHQVLDDSIELWVLVLNSWDRHVLNISEETWKDDIAQVLEQMWLEGRLAVLIVSKILEELVEGLGEALVLWVLIELISQELDLIHNAISVVAVTITEKEVATIVQIIPLVRGTILHDVSLLLQDLADVRVQVTEELLQLGILVGILVNGVERIEKVVGRGAVGKSFNERLERCQLMFVVIIYSYCKPSS